MDTQLWSVSPPRKSFPGSAPRQVKELVRDQKRVQRLLEDATAKLHTRITEALLGTAVWAMLVIILITKSLR